MALCGDISTHYCHDLTELKAYYLINIDRENNERVIADPTLEITRSAIFEFPDNIMSISWDINREILLA